MRLYWFLVLSTALHAISPFQDGITHSNRNNKTSATMLWTAPAVGTGPLEFGLVQTSYTWTIIIRRLYVGESYPITNVCDCTV